MGRSKIYGVPGLGLKTGAQNFFGCQKGGLETSFDERNVGACTFFSLKKRRGHCLYFLIKRGQHFFYLSSFGRESLFPNNSEPWQSMPLSKSGNKLLEITRDPYFEDIKGEYCTFGAVQMGEGEGARSFFEG